MAVGTWEMDFFGVFVGSLRCLTHVLDL